MKVKDLTGHIHNWNLTGHIASPNESRPRSQLHIVARELLKKEYPTDHLLEELTIPGEQLFLDFFIPRIKTAFEIQGEQHFNYVSHFHSSPQAFKRGKINDKRKSDWCDLNNIKIIYLLYSESPSDWLRKIRL